MEMDSELGTGRDCAEVDPRDVVEPEESGTLKCTRFWLPRLALSWIGVRMSLIGEAKICRGCKKGCNNELSKYPDLKSDDTDVTKGRHYVDHVVDVRTVTELMAPTRLDEFPQFVRHFLRTRRTFGPLPLRHFEDYRRVMENIVEWCTTRVKLQQ